MAIKLGPANQAVQNKKKSLWCLIHRACHKKDPNEELSGFLYKDLTAGLLEAINPHLVKAKYGDCGQDDGDQIRDEKAVADEHDHKQIEQSAIKATQDAARGELAKHRDGKKSSKPDVSHAEHRANWIREMDRTGTYSFELIEAALKLMEDISKKEGIAAWQQPPNWSSGNTGLPAKYWGFAPSSPPTMH